MARIIPCHTLSLGGYRLHRGDGVEDEATGIVYYDPVINGDLMSEHQQQEVSLVRHCVGLHLLLAVRGHPLTMPVESLLRLPHMHRGDAVADQQAADEHQSGALAGDLYAHQEGSLLLGGFGFLLRRLLVFVIHGRVSCKMDEEI